MMREWTLQFSRSKVKVMGKCEIMWEFLCSPCPFEWRGALWWLHNIYFCPRLSRKRGIFKLIRPSVCQSVCLSVPVTKTLTWLISFELLMIEHLYLACMILVTSPFYWYHAVTLTFDLLQGQICCRAGDHNSSNLLVIIYCIITQCIVDNNKSNTCNLIMIIIDEFIYISLVLSGIDKMGQYGIVILSVAGIRPGTWN